MHDEQSKLKKLEYLKETEPDKYAVWESLFSPTAEMVADIRQRIRDKLNGL